MRLLRLVVSDLHLGTGYQPGQMNPLEDFFHDEKFTELIAYYDMRAGDAEMEVVMNGDIFDLLKVKIDGEWPTEITEAIACDKLRQCMDGHPKFVRALRDLMEKDRRRIVYLPGNHDLDMWFPAAQALFTSYVSPGAPDRVRFITKTDTYSLPEGIQIRHGHQLERVHRVDYQRMTRKRRDGIEVLDLPWGSLWILEVMNPAKEERTYIDRIQPLGRFLAGSLIFDPSFVFRFMWRSFKHFVQHRVFGVRAWRERMRTLNRMLREEIFSLGTMDDAAIRELRKLKGVRTLIVGHSHTPRYQSLPTGKVLINTGTWVPMINLDLRYLGQTSGLTYALIEYDHAGVPRASLLRWQGTHEPFETIHYAD